MRPVKALPSKKSASPTEPEALHLYLHRDSNSIKKAHVPIGEEGDCYLLAVVMDCLEEMEANGEDGNELTLPACLAKVTEHLDLGDDEELAERRLLSIWRYALFKLTRAKIDGVEFDLEETKKALEESEAEMRENISLNANRLDHLEERVDDLEDNQHQEMVKKQREMAEVSARLHRLEMAAGLVSLFDASSSHVKVPKNLERHLRTARARTLTKKEADTIKDYTTDEGYAEINVALRAAVATGPNAVALSREISNKKRIIEGALDKIAKPYVGRVYRGVDMPKAWMEGIKAQINAGARGRLSIPFSDAAFLSTSSRLSGYFKRKTCRFVIQSKKGKEIAAYSVHPDEHEVLFPTSTKFTIFDAMECDNGNMFIRMRED